MDSTTTVRYWVTSTGKARGGWIVAAYGTTVEGNSVKLPNFRENIATKAEAKALAAQLNGGK
jgi:hypothetical protein